MKPTDLEPNGFPVWACHAVRYVVDSILFIHGPPPPWERPPAWMVFGPEVERWHDKDGNMAPPTDWELAELAWRQANDWAGCADFDKLEEQFAEDDRYKWAPRT